MMKDNQSKDIMPVGKMVLRFKYPDGRLTALVAVDGDWQVQVFPTELAARAFALDHNLEVTEINDDPA